MTRVLYEAYSRTSPWYRAGRLAHYRAVLASAERFDRRELESFQLGLLRDLLSCAEKTPFYARRFREVGLSASGLRSTEDLERLPVLEKRDVNVDPRTLHVPNAPRFRPGATSGTTGEPMRVRTTAEMDAAARAARWRMFSWYGVPFGARTLAFKGGNQKRDRVLAATWKFASDVLGQTLRDAYRHSMEDGVRELVRLRPEVLLGYPSVLSELASAADRMGVDLRRSGVGLVVCGGESFPESTRRALGRAFAVPARSLYGSHEGHYMGMECPEGSLHVQETVLLEIVRDDGSRAPAGEAGEVVITPLLGRAMPLLRYRLGDRGRLMDAPCPCGRATPTVGLDVCRVTEMVDLGNGRRVNSQLFQPMIHHAFGLRFGVDPESYRVVQTGPRSLEFQLVLPRGAALPPGAGAFVGDLVRGALGGGIDVHVVQARSLVRDASGKRRTFIPPGEAPRFRLGSGLD